MCVHSVRDAKMQIGRRQFIKIGTAAGGTFLLPSVLSGCAGGTPEALSAWKGHHPDDHDVRHIVPSYAILACCLPAIARRSSRRSMRPVRRDNIVSSEWPGSAVS